MLIIIIIPLISERETKDPLIGLMLISNLESISNIFFDQINFFKSKYKST